MTGTLLTAEDLACIRGGRRVFAGASFALDAGEALLLRGPNGSGKSSLLRLLAGFLAPAFGRIAWQGEEIGRDLAAHRTRLHYVGHANGIKSELSARENLAFAAALGGASRDGTEMALDALALTPLADVPCRLFSAGQKRRLALARLLAAPRPLWLLDEPGVGLDAASRERLETAVATHLDGGGIALLATHGDIDLPRALTLDLDPDAGVPCDHPA